MAICFKRQSASNVLTPEVGHVYLFVDRNGFPSVKDSSGLVTLLVSSVSGPAGGGLAGAFPNPTVVATPALKTSSGLVTVSSSVAPESGQVLTAVDSGTAIWQDFPPTEPSGVAGGDLAGTFPAPIALRTAGLKNASTAVSTTSSGVPSSGQWLIATSSTTATWQDPPPSTPGGPAGGNLAGSYPNPSVVAAAALRNATTNVSSITSTAPSTGQLLIANGGTAASWQSPSPDLGNTWSSPTVIQARGLKSATTTVSISGSAAPAAGYALRASSSTVASWSRLDTYVRNEILDPPLSPDPADEEFTTDPFLSGSWTVYVQSPFITPNWQPMSREGDVTPRSDPGNLTYRSTLAGSTVFVQAARSQGNGTFFMKAIPSPTSGDQTWTFGFGGVAGLTPQSGGTNYGMILCGTSGGLPDYNNKILFVHNNNDNQGVTNDLWTGVTSAGVFTAGPVFTSNAMGVSGFSGMMIRKGASQLSGSGPNTVTFGFFGPNGEMAVLPSGVTSFSGNWAYVGFLISMDASTGGAEVQWADIIALHFMRRKQSTSYIFG